MATAQPKWNFIPAVLLVLGGLLLVTGTGGTIFEIFPPKPNPDAWFILVDQFEDREGPYANFVNNQEFKVSIAERKINYRNWDADQAEGKAIAESLKLPLPFYAVATETKLDGKQELKIVASGPAPTTVAEANAILEKWIGK